MTLVAEKIVVTAKEFLNKLNINDSQEFNEPFFQNKIKEFNWELSFSASSIACEIIWKKALRGGGMVEGRKIDRLFSPSPVATHSNFRGCKDFKTGNGPEPGSIVVWRRGCGWQGIMAIVTWVSEDKKSFDIIEAHVLQGSDNRFITLEEKKNKRADIPFKSDKFNILGFIYPPNREIT